MALLVLALVVVLALSLAMWATFGLIALMLTLFMAGLVGWAADAVIPGTLPGGWLGAILAGIAGGILGRLILGNVGPALFGIHLVPTFFGALLVVAAAELLLSTRTGNSLS